MLGASMLAIEHALSREHRGDAGLGTTQEEAPNAEGPRRSDPFLKRVVATALTSSGTPGPNVVETLPFWM